MDNFLKKYNSWVDWRAADPDEYKYFEVLGRQIFKGGDYEHGSAQQGFRTVYKVFPWTEIWTWSFRQVKMGFDPLQIISALEYIIENSKKFTELDPAHKYGHLNLVMKNRQIAANETRWQTVKMGKNTRFAASKSIVSEVDNIISNIELRMQLEEMKKRLSDAGITP